MIASSCTLFYSDFRFFRVNPSTAGAKRRTAGLNRVRLGKIDKQPMLCRMVVEINRSAAAVSLW